MTTPCPNSSNTTALSENCNMIGHKITVHKRYIAYAFPRRHDERLGDQYRASIREHIVWIRRLQNNPTDRDRNWNPAHPE